MFISIYLSFPVFCVVFPDFSSLFKIPWLFPDWKMPSHFSRFPVRVGTLPIFPVWVATLNKDIIATVYKLCGHNNHICVCHTFCPEIQQSLPSTHMQVTAMCGANFAFPPPQWMDQCRRKESRDTEAVLYLCCFCFLLGFHNHLLHLSVLFLSFFWNK